jgi:hypothetical protein
MKHGGNRRVTRRQSSPGFRQFGHRELVMHAREFDARRTSKFVADLAAHDKIVDEGSALTGRSI